MCKTPGFTMDRFGPFGTVAVSQQARPLHCLDGGHLAFQHNWHIHDPVCALVLCNLRGFLHSSDGGNLSWHHDVYIKDSVLGRLLRLLEHWHLTLYLRLIEEKLVQINRGTWWPWVRHGITYAEVTQKLVIDFFSVQGRPKINFWSGTHYLALCPSSTGGLSDNDNRHSLSAHRSHEGNAIPHCCSEA